jgi:hypothetical protein
MFRVDDVKRARKNHRRKNLKSYINLSWIGWGLMYRNEHPEDRDEWRALVHMGVNLWV